MRLELTLPALEKLIGGETAIELDLRKAIVVEFARRHLKEVATEEIYKGVLAEIRKHVNIVVKEQLDVSEIATAQIWPSVSARLRSLITSVVESHAQKAVDAALLKIIEYQKRYCEFCTGSPSAE